MSLLAYRQKRKFQATPEPQGRQKTEHPGQLIFVVQKHAATALHYDFRLEMEGVLKSWAVPKGPSLNPKDKRLAMMTEDHPMDYAGFEGLIPQGNYGAGQVIVWDQGYYRPFGKSLASSHAMSKGLKRGLITFELFGEKLKGAFSLIKLKQQKNAWLLVKKHDRFAATKDITADQSSVVSDKALENKTKKEVFSTKPKKDFVKPMLATLVEQAFNDPNWIFEIKWDGYRAIAETYPAVRLYSRSQQDFTKKYPEVTADLKKIKRPAILDGEIVVLGSDGRGDFQALQNYGNAEKGNLVYKVFDLLELDNKDLKHLPLTERKSQLQKILPKNSNVIEYTEHITESGQEFFKAAKQQKLEGIMAKRADSPYQEGARSKDWLKIKSGLRQEAIICGFTEPEGSRKYFGSLILGLMKNGQLNYAGHVGTGFNFESLKKIHQKLESLVRGDSPFKNPPKLNATWVNPKLVCEVSFTEWTHDGLMRHPSFKGLREDKPIKDVKPESVTTIENPAPELDNNKMQNIKPKQSNFNSKAELTHLDKIFWPKEKYTKGDLLDYYNNVSQIILPYLKDRPQSLNRFPNGINGANFFQKNYDNQVPSFVKTTKIKLKSEPSSDRFLVCNNLDALLYLINLGCIELNPWSSRVSHLHNPDYGIIDLDPEGVSFEKVVETALVVRKILEKLEIKSCVKTSGKSGMHIVIPLAAKYTYEQTRQFVEILVNLIHNKLPQLTSLERKPQKRQKQIYLDFLQNNIGQTIAAPYSVRPWPGATVSTPLNWNEVNKKLDPANFTIKTIFKRLDKYGDLWKPVLGKGVDLKKILARIKGRKFN